MSMNLLGSDVNRKAHGRLVPVFAAARK